jgi:hypothetical protein
MLLGHLLGQVGQRSQRMQIHSKKQILLVMMERHGFKGGGLEGGKVLCVPYLDLGGSRVEGSVWQGMVHATP